MFTNVTLCEIIIIIFVTQNTIVWNVILLLCLCRALGVTTLNCYPIITPHSSMQFQKSNLEKHKVIRLADKLIFFDMTRSFFVSKKSPNTMRTPYDTPACLDTDFIAVFVDSEIIALTNVLLYSTIDIDLMNHYQ